MRLASGFQIEKPGCPAGADGCEIGRARQHTGQISRHNLCMKAHAKLTNPFVANPPAFGAALQSNKVYPPRLRSVLATGIAQRRINAIR